MSGWFAVKRGITKHPIFQDQPLRLAAWIWMLDTAAWKDTKQDAGGKVVEVKRGQLLTSFRQMSKATGVPVQPLRTLIKRLQEANAIQTDSNTGRMLITICNYDKYQTPQKPANTGATQEQHRSNTQKEQGNKETSIPVGADKSADPVKVMFDAGRAVLCEAGKTKEQAGRLLGKWRKDHGDEALMTAISRAKREGAIEPVSFIEGCFKFQAKKERPEPGERRVINGKQKVYVNHFEGWMNETC